MGYNKRADFPSLSSQVWNQPLKMSWAYQWHSVTMSISSIFTCFICFVSIIMFILQSFPKKNAFFRNNRFFHPAFGGLLRDCSQNDEGHFRFRSEHSEFSLHPHLHNYTFETCTCICYRHYIYMLILFTHTHIIYIYILCCTRFNKRRYVNLLYLLYMYWYTVYPSTFLYFNSPAWIRKDLCDFCRSHGIILMSTSPLARGALARQTSPLKSMAERLRRSAAEVAIRWCLQQGEGQFGALEM